MLDHEIWTKPANITPDFAQELEALGLAPDSYIVQPLDVIRRTMARRMTASFSEVPHFSLKTTIHADALLAARASLNNRADAPCKISFNDLIIRAAALAIARYPAINASYTANGILLHQHADIAVAVSIAGGLITPIVRQAETKSLDAISAEMKDLADRARRKRLQPNEYFGGTMTISNLGMYGITEFTSIINQPQACILSIGTPFETTAAHANGCLQTHMTLTPTLTCDHRVVDGVMGATWLQHFRELIENPDQWTLDQ